jgi:hypothetical protein
MPGYVQVAYERLDMGRMTVVGFVLIPVWSFLFVGAISLLGGRSSFSFHANIWTLLIGAFVALIAVPVLHELVHGVVGWICGARPAYGIGPGFAYTTFREPLTRGPYLAIGLAPLVVLSIVAVVFAARWDMGAGWLLFFAVVNAAGAIGDLWMSWTILRQPPSSIFFDLADGFAVLAPEHAQ